MMSNPTTTPALQLLSIRAIFLESWRLYGRHWRPFMAANAIFLVAYTLLDIMQVTLATRDLGEPVETLLSLLFGAVQFFIIAIGSAAIVLIADAATAGHSLDALAAYRLVLARLRPIARTALSVFLMILLSITVVAIPFVIYRLVGWAVSLPAILLEGCDGRTALAHSTRLVRGQRWRVLAVLLAISVPISAASLAIDYWLGAQSLWPENYAALQVLGTLPTDIILGTPIYIAYHVLYRALRDRKDFASASTLLAAAPDPACRKCKYPNLPNRMRCHQRRGSLGQRGRRTLPGAW